MPKPMKYDPVIYWMLHKHFIGIPGTPYLLYSTAPYQPSRLVGKFPNRQAAVTLIARGALRNPK